MADDNANVHDSVGAWAKRYYHANRAAIESVLRPYDVGTTQWYMLYELANSGPTRQSDLGQLLKLERATLSGIVAALVRKGFIEQVADRDDQRHRMLQLTDAGRALWERLPDPIVAIQSRAFQGSTPDELDTAIRVLRDATERLSAWSGSPLSAEPGE